MSYQSLVYGLKHAHIEVFMCNILNHEQVNESGDKLFINSIGDTQNELKAANSGRISTNETNLVRSKCPAFNVKSFTDRFEHIIFP